MLGTPFFIVFGSLSDKIGRKPIILAGCLLAALTYFPLFKALTEAANPTLAAAQAKTQGRGHGRPERVLVPVQPDRARAKFTSSCDIAKQLPGAQRRSATTNVDAPAGTPATHQDRRQGDRRATPRNGLAGRRSDDEAIADVQEGASADDAEGGRLSGQGRPGAA